MLKSVMPILATFLAAFGFGGKSKGFSRLGFVPEGYIGIPERFGKVVRFRAAARPTRIGRYRTHPRRIWLGRWRKQPRYRIMRWRRFDPVMAGHCPYRFLRWRRFNSEVAGKPKYRHPGWNKGIPFLDKTHHVTGRDVVKPIKLEQQKMQLRDKTIFHVVAGARVRIVDPDIVSFRVAHFEEQLKQRCEATLMRVLSRLDAGEIQKINRVNNKLLKQAVKFAAEFGIEFCDFEILASEPSDRSAQIIQADRAIGARVDAIAKHAKTLAGVNSIAALIAGGNTVITGDSNNGAGDQIGTSAPDENAKTSQTGANIIPFRSVPDTGQ